MLFVLVWLVSLVHRHNAGQSVLYHLNVHQLLRVSIKNALTHVSQRAV